MVCFVYLYRSLDALDQSEEQRQSDRHDPDPRIDPSVALTVSQSLLERFGRWSGPLHSFSEDVQAIAPEPVVTEITRRIFLAEISSFQKTPIQRHRGRGRTKVLLHPLLVLLFVVRKEQDERLDRFFDEALGKRGTSQPIQSAAV